jgi:OFA family oxalate/formate antiporter-like MFS transporter
MNAANRQYTRRLTLLGTIITQFALGSVYTWSLFNSSLSSKLDEPVSQVAFSFGLLSLGLALSSSVAGKLQERLASNASPWRPVSCWALASSSPRIQTV